MDKKRSPVEKEVVVQKVIAPVAPVKNATSWSGTQGKKGYKLPRMNLAFHPETYNKIKTEAKKVGMTYSEFLTMLVHAYEKK